MERPCFPRILIGKFHLGDGHCLDIAFFCFPK
jgi:hypothetical protein